MYMKGLKPVIRQQTPVYHEVTFFFASNDPHTIIDFGRSFTLNGFKSSAPVHKHWCFAHAAVTLVYIRK